MKKIYLLYIVLISLATTSLIGCSDWTESEAKTFPESIVSDEYYAALLFSIGGVVKHSMVGNKAGVVYVYDNQ